MTTTFRAQLEQLVRSESTPSASSARVWNEAIRAAITLFDQHETLRKKRSESRFNEMRDDDKKIGSITYGRRVGDDGETLIDDPEEQKTKKMACDLRQKGLTLRAIGEELVKLGRLPRIVKRDGKMVQPDEWHPAQIKRLVAELDVDAKIPTKKAQTR